MWFTVADGVLSDVYEPTIDNTNVKSLQYVVTDGSSFTDLQTRDLTYTVATDPTGMSCTITATSAAHGYQLVTTYVADAGPRRGAHAHAAAGARRHEHQYQQTSACTPTWTRTSTATAGADRTTVERTPARLTPSGVGVIGDCVHGEPGDQPRLRGPDVHGVDVTAAADGVGRLRRHRRRTA